MQVGTPLTTGEPALAATFHGFITLERPQGTPNARGRTQRLNANPNAPNAIRTRNETQAIAPTAAIGTLRLSQTLNASQTHD